MWIVENYGIICVIMRNPLSTSNQNFPGAGTFLTSLRLFVKENFLRSRKAQSYYTKYLKLKNAQIIHKTCLDVYDYGIMCVILRNSLSTFNQYFPGAGTFLTSLRLFVEKIFFEISQSSIWLYKIPKTQNRSNNTQNMSKCLWLWHNVRDSEKSTFHLQSVFSRSWNFSDKSQIVCRENIFEISQSSIWLYKSMKSRNAKQNERNTWNRDNNGIMWAILINSLLISNQYFLELELLWQVSDVLSRKIFLRSRTAQYDYTTICKSRKIEKCLQIVCKWWYLVMNSAILRNSFFTSNQCAPGAGTSLTSLRWFVKEKFSEISQSSTWLYQNMQKLKKLRNVYNLRVNGDI